MEKILRIEEVSQDYTDGYAIVTDKQTIKLLIDNQQDCCEEWGYFMSDDDLEYFIGSNLIDVAVVSDSVPLCIKKLREHLPYGIEDGDVMFVNIITDKGVLQFVAYNAHNGYYGHDAYVFSEQVKYETSL